MMRHSIFKIMALCILALILASCETATAPTTAPTEAPAIEPTDLPAEEPTKATAETTLEPIRIGFTTGLSGANAALSEGQIRGAELAIKQINGAGGLLGRPVEMVVRDDKTQPAEAARNTEEMIINDNVVMMQAGGTVACMQAVQEVTKRAGVMYIANGQGNSFNEAAVRGPYDYHMGLSPWQNDHVLVPWVVENLGSRIFMMYYDMAFGTDHYAAVTDALSQEGLELVGEVSYPFGTSDYSSIIPQIRAAKPEVLITVVSGADRAAFLKQARSFGLHEEMDIVNVIATTSWDILSGFTYNEGEYGISHFDWAMRDEIPTAKTFVDGFYQDYDVVPDGYAFYTYQAVMVWADGVREAGSPEPVEVSAAMEEMGPENSFDYGAGPAYIRKCDHKLFLSMYIVQGRGEEEAKSVEPWPQWAFRQVVAVIPPDESAERTCEQLGY